MGAPPADVVHGARAVAAGRVGPGVTGRVVVVANRGALRMKRTGGLPLDAMGGAAEVTWTSGRDAARLAREAVGSGASTVIAAGGDGTISSVAGVLAGGDVPLGVLPLGTLNHFAKDLGVPRDLREAAQVAARGEVRRVDMGDAGGRLFVNTVAFGPYFEVVRRRDRWRRFVGKWPAFVLAFLVELARTRFARHLEITVGDGAPVRVPLAWLGCGDYRVSGPGVGTRERMDAGHLTLVMLRASGRRAFLHAFLHVIRGRAQDATELDVRRVERVTVGHVHGHALRCVVDGERVTLPSPVTLSVRRGALPVRAP